MLHGPLEYGMRQCGVSRLEISKRKQCDDTLRHAMDVDRICPVVEISRGAILAKEVRSVELKTTPNGRSEFRRARIAANVLQRAKVISGVEVINPSLRSPLPVIPGTITVLLSC